MINNTVSVRRSAILQKSILLFKKLYSEKSFRSLIFRFLLLFACVCIGTLAEYCVLHVLAQSMYPILLTIIYFFISFCSSPILTGYSDNDLRKVILVITLVACSFSFAFTFFLDGTVSLVSAGVLIFVVGIFGNLIETAWAAMGDERVGASNARCLFAISNSFMALAALLFSAVKLYKLQFLAHLFEPNKLVTKNFSDSYLLYAIIGIFLTGIICWKYQDRHDKDVIPNEGKSNSFFSLINRVLHHLGELIRSNKFRLGIIVFSLWEVAFYLIHQVGIDLKIRPFNSVTKWMAGGYILGTLLLPFFQNSEEKRLIHIGHSISILSLIIGIILSVFSYIPLHPLVDSCFAVFAVGAAFLSPTLFSSVSAEVPVHRQGVLFGSYGSADTLATALAWLLGEALRNLIAFLHEQFNLQFISPLIMISLSLFIMFGAVLFYGKFSKITKS